MKDLGKVVVLGVGYGGLRLALDLEAGLRRGGWTGELILVDRYPFHQLVTEFHQLAAGSIVSEYATILLEKILGGKRVRFRQARITGFDLDGGRVFSDAQTFPFDHLVIALGGETDFLDSPTPLVPGLRKHGLAVSSIQPANAAHVRLQERLFAYTKERRFEREPFTIVIGGGGTTGVELAGQLADEMPQICRTYRIPREAISVHMVERADRLVPGFDPRISIYIAKVLRRKGITLHLEEGITRVDAGKLHLQSGAELPYSILLWAGGVRGNHTLEHAGLKTDPKGRLIVNGYLQVQEYDRVYAIGDCCNYIHPELGITSAPTARLAIDQARWLARYLMGQATFPFIPTFKGGVISLGTGAAVALIGNLRFYGRLAYLIKSLTTIRYIFSIGGVRLLAHQLRMGVLGKI